MWVGVRFEEVGWKSAGWAECWVGWVHGRGRELSAIVVIIVCQAPSSQRMKHQLLGRQQQHCSKHDQQQAVQQACQPQQQLAPLGGSSSTVRAAPAGLTRSGTEGGRGGVPRCQDH